MCDFTSPGITSRMVQSTKLGIPIQPPPQNLTKNPTSGYLHQDSKHSHHHHIGGGGGGLPELKKKMKRSGSVKKASDFHKISEIQRKPTSLLSRKPPPLPTSAPPPSTPQKSPPNYMKSTTSSEARKDKEKERSPVSKSLNSASSSSSGSGKRKPSPAGDEGRSPSVKRKKKTTARALTKVPSFKKCSSKLGPKNVRRSTCSSTMKDSKFPPYLELDHGATEGQGTSAMKICPYTYCSLNGHHHQPLPPLKCFLKAKRRSLKAQKSVKLGGPLSPRRRPVAAGETVGVSDVEEAEDFFVEFYTQGTDYDHNDAPTMDEGEDVKLVEEQNPLDEIPDSESEFEGDMKRFGDISSSGEEMVLEISSFDGGIKDGEDDEEDDGQSCEDTEMEWVQGLDSSFSQVDVEGEQLLEFEKPDEMVKSNDIASSNCTEEILTKELLRDLFEEETEAATSSATSEIGDQETVGNDGFQELEEEEEEGRVDNTCKIRILNVMNPDVEKHEGMKELRSFGNEEAEVLSDTEDEDSDKSNAEDAFTAAKQGTAAGVSGGGRNSSKQDLEDDSSSNDWKWKIGSRRAIEEMGENERDFNPKDPNFLPLVEDPEGEKVDLKHQTMDERRNSEEWMIDHALQQTVTKLATARKRKVALLVEAFETVSPIIPKIEPRMIRHPSASSPIFSPTSMQIQACR